MGLKESFIRKLMVNSISSSAIILIDEFTNLALRECAEGAKTRDEVQISGKVCVHPLAADKPPSKNAAPIRASTTSARVFDETSVVSTDLERKGGEQGGVTCVQKPFKLPRESYFCPRVAIRSDEPLDKEGRRKCRSVFNDVRCL
jgi:hypothetical protein